MRIYPMNGLVSVTLVTKRSLMLPKLTYNFIMVLHLVLAGFLKN